MKNEKVKKDYIEQRKANFKTPLKELLEKYRNRSTPLRLFHTILFLISCGMMPMKPMTPMGCSDTQAVCICDGSGDCSWIWICTE